MYGSRSKRVSQNGHHMVLIYSPSLTVEAHLWALHDLHVRTQLQKRGSR
jgi:hypothetical protein